MPWPLACVVGFVSFAVIGTVLDLMGQPPILEWVSYLAAGITAGAAARRRGLLAAALGGWIVTAGLLVLLVAIGKAAIGRHYEVARYGLDFVPLLVMGLVLPPVGGVAGRALREWFSRRYGRGVTEDKM